ncbi:hypothetical protein [Streptomyces beijiangensis]|uniref:Uncharacterized protein n=1 Tax=Streptomyces beijiangensis TaxID=163361 RepID=A0A939F8E8_9ACTN|nr:hypothetical protein [Streptomyces beijiangensis]MBO0514285.1 hypothetical protein [Streptomyces beijiangensis]
MKTRKARGRANTAESVLHSRFAILAESLLTGVWLTVAALPLLTLLPAFAAGCAHLRRHLDSDPCGWREFVSDVREATRSGLRFSLLWWAGIAVLVFDWRVARTGLLPGGPLLIAVSVVGLLALAVVGLRTAAAWRPGGSWVLVRTSDPAGSLLLVGGFAAVAATAWQVPPLAAPALGCLAAAAVALERRAALR